VKVDLSRSQNVERRWAFALAMLLVATAGCAPAPAAKQPPKRNAREEAEIAANVKRQVELDKMAKKLEEAELAATRKERELLAERTIGLGQSLRLGDLQITPQRAEYRKVRWRPGSAPQRGFEEAGPYLVITLGAKNTSSGAHFKPETRIQGSDSSGNRLKSPFPELSLPIVEGSNQHEPLGPDGEATIIVCVERKLAKARAYELERSTTASDSKKFDESSQRYLLKINADEIELAGRG
jgi:hypothetical protein